MCELVATDDAALADFVANEIATSPGVVGIETVRTAEIVKWVGAAGAPRQSSPPAEESLDELDVAILRELARDPRLKVRRLAEMVDAPYTAVRRRSARLFESGIVEAVAVTERSDSVVAVTLLEARVTAEILPSVAALPDVSIVSRTIGRFSAVVEISAASTEAVVRSLDEIEALPGVVRLESLIVARSLKLATPWKFLRRSISAS
ncbi:MAG: Lrp/AsnC family transcriptional regulator [Microbacterium sp.]|nr:MAG: Lrp/AsnC family transcriptional regulator [Microbacterium sp.]